MKKIKMIKWIVIGLAVLIVCAGAIVLANLDGIVRRTVESQATSSLDLKTTLAGASVSIFGQSLALDDLKIASPQGYTAPQMLAFDKAAVHVSVSQLRGEPIHIKQVQIDSPAIALELNGTKLNFQTLMDKPSSTPVNDKTQQPTTPIKVIIDELTVTNPKVQFIPGGAFASLGIKQYSLTLPSITLNNIGTGEGASNGVAIKDVVMQLLTTIAGKAADSDQLPSQLKDILHANVQQMAQQLGKQFQDQLGKQLGNIGGDLGKNVGDALKNNDAGKSIEKSVGDLLGGKKKDDKQKK